MKVKMSIEDLLNRVESETDHKRIESIFGQVFKKLSFEVNYAAKEFLYNFVLLQTLETKGKNLPGGGRYKECYAEFIDVLKKAFKTGVESEMTEIGTDARKKQGLDRLTLESEFEIELNNEVCNN